MNHVFVYICLVFYYVTFIMLFMLYCQSYAFNVIVLSPRCWFFLFVFFWFCSINLFIYSPFILLALYLYDNYSVAFHYFNYLWCHHLFTWLFIDRLLLFICLLSNSYFMGMGWITIHFYYCYYFYYRWQVVRKLIKESVTAFLES